jgi:MATE family multidrug resistance protein
MFVILPRPIAHAYSHDDKVITFSVTLFAIAAVFQLFDGLQTVATGALRGAANTRTAMIWNLFGYWIIGLPLGYWLCFSRAWGATGLWTGLCLALILIGLALVDVWRRTARSLLRSGLPG